MTVHKHDDFIVAAPLTAQDTGTIIPYPALPHNPDTVLANSCPTLLINAKHQVR